MEIIFLKGTRKNKHKCEKHQQKIIAKILLKDYTNRTSMAGIHMDTQNGYTGITAKVCVELLPR